MLSFVLFLVHHSRRHMLPVNIITSDVNFDHLVKVMFAKLLHYEVTILPFKVNKYFVGRYFGTVQISSHSSNFHPLVLASYTDNICLNQLL